MKNRLLNSFFRAAAAFALLLAAGACKDDVALPMQRVALNTHAILAPSFATTLSFDVEANCDWTISVAGDDTSWAELSQTEATGMATVAVSIAENNTSGSRALTIRVAAKRNAAVVEELSFVQASATAEGYLSIPDLRKLAADGDYRKFLQNSGPQFVWNALYRRSAIGNLLFDEHCRYGLEDFIFNAGLYARTDKVHYLPQPVYRHFESGQSTSQCQTVQALQGRIGVLDRWMAAEYKAIQARCPEAARAAVWNDRRAQAITFLMHQLADAKAPGALRRHGWRTLRGVLARYPAPPLDLWHEAKHHKKQTGALLLYNLRLQRLYELWANRPKNRRRELP